jgi:hypothetical protein
VIAFTVTFLARKVVDQSSAAIVIPVTGLAMKVQQELIITARLDFIRLSNTR